MNDTFIPFTISKTKDFSYSNEFSQSNKFQNDIEFSKSSFNNQANDFSNSNEFSQSNKFQNDIEFSKSSFNDQTNTNAFIKPSYLYESNTFAETKHTFYSHIISQNQEISNEILSGIFSKSKLSNDSELASSFFILVETTSNIFSEDKYSKNDKSENFLSTSKITSYLQEFFPSTNKKGKINIFAIIGIIIGCLLFISISLIIIFVFFKKRNKTENNQFNNEEIKSASTQEIPNKTANLNQEDLDELADLNFWL